MKDKYYMHASGNPFLGNYGRYCVVIGPEKSYFLYENGRTDLCSFREPSSAWTKVTKHEAYELLGLNKRVYYIRKSYDGVKRLFGLYTHSQYAIFFQGDEGYSLRKDGSTKRMSDCYTRLTAANDWQQVSEEVALQLLGIEAKKYDHRELEAAFKRIDEEAARKKAEVVLQFAPSDDEKSPLLYRYLRYHHDLNETSEVQGNGGLAVGVVINYTKKQMIVWPAVCSLTDTFDKQKAKQVINFRRSRRQFLVLPYLEHHTLTMNLLQLCGGVTPEAAANAGALERDELIATTHKFADVLMHPNVW